MTNDDPPRRVRVYKLEVTVVDHGDMGLSEITNLIENNHYIHPRVIGTPLARDVEWVDSHPINKSDGRGEAALIELFAPSVPMPEMRPLDDFHRKCLMTREDYEGGVECGGLTDYDGCGDLATATHVSDVTICPSDTEDYTWPEWATHVCWYNK